LAGQLHAKRYAQAVFEIAREKKDLDRWQVDLENAALLARNPEILGVMENPKIPSEVKARLASRELRDVSPLALNLVRLLISKRMFGLIEDVCAEYQEMLNDYREIAKAEVITAVPLEEDERERIEKHLEAISGKKIVLTATVDEAIIGGVVARISGKLIDGSTRSKLIALRNELAESRR
jgi:F-type H+-transporting ATPase subunit delta